MAYNPNNPNGQATMAASAPVVIASNQSAVPVSGTVAVSGTVPVSAASLPLPTGASTETTLSALNTKVTTTANGVKVDGSAVTQPVSGTVGISGTPTVTANIGATNGLGLDSTLTNGTAKTITRGAAKGATTAGDVTSTNVDANTQALDVSVKGTVSTSPSSDVTSSGTITALNGSVALALNGQSGGTIQITGTWVATLQFEGTIDGTNWTPINGVYAGASTPTVTTTANGLVRVTPAGLSQFRITATAFTSGTATISMRASIGTGGTFLNQSLTAGSNTIGSIANITGNMMTSTGGFANAAGAKSDNQSQGQTARLKSDTAGNLMVRAEDFTDAGSWKEDFSGSTIGYSIPVNPTFDSTTAIVTGSGFLTTFFQVSNYIKRDSDADTAWTRIASIDSDTQLTLASNYLGTTGSSASTISKVGMLVQTGTSFLVTGSLLSILSGTTSGSNISAYRNIDYGPLSTAWSGFFVNQRIVNQDVILGLQDSSQLLSTNARYYARFRFTGTTNTTVICETAYVNTGVPSGSDISTATITLPNGLTTAQASNYRIDVNQNDIVFTIAEVEVFRTAQKIPGPYDILQQYVGFVNTGVPASSSTLVLDGINVRNFNALDIGTNSRNTLVKAIPQDGDTFTPALTAVATVVTVPVGNASWLALQVAGTFVATVITEVSNDNVNWVTGFMSPTNSTTPVALVSQFTGVGTWQIPVTTKFVRLRCSAFTSNTSGVITVVRMYSAPNPIPYASTIGTVSALNTITPGTAATNLGKARGTATGATDTGVLSFGTRVDALATQGTANANQQLITDAFGSLQVGSFEKKAKTFSASLSATLAAAATDVLTITGNATNTCYVTKITLSGQQTTISTVLTKLIKRSTANSAGTSTAGVAVPHDSNDAAAVSTTLQYTANPTTGTAVGTIRNQYIVLGQATTSTNNVTVFDFGAMGRPIVLRGITQVLAVNLGSATVAGGILNADIEWFEI